MSRATVQKVLVIGSGPIVIGQAAEFDYAGTQACKALREEGVKSILVNSNPATIMTDPGVADVVYIEPLTVESIERIIQRERPDGLLPTLGGQTGLNLAVEVADAGILDRYGVRLLGTPLETIKQAEDRELFKQLLISIGEPVPASATVRTLDEALALRERMPLPLIIRPAFTLGGTGGGIARTDDEYRRTVSRGLQASPISQVLVERSLIGWKELEYEVMRDAADTCITVCNMENLDPMGVHTGDSMVVAPSQTLSDKEYQMLRSAALKIIRALGIEGGCNIQFGLNPQSREYYVIEVNPRVSRSSALASKATGYPIARVAAKIAVGRRLDEIANAVTQKTTAAFEPALDYCVVKIPRWPFDKFASGDRTLGTQMKATGEVMAVDRSFEAALQKAVRSLENGGRSLAWESPTWASEMSDEIWDLIERPNDLRIWAVMAALRREVEPAEISRRSGMDPWFIRRMQRLVGMERRLLSEQLTPTLLREAKRLGFSDVQVGTLADLLPEQVRQTRDGWKIRPVYKMVDTCAAEFEAFTPYFYSTYDQENEAVSRPGPRALVIGSGPIRIGQGIEFDYCSVHSAWALQQAGVRALMVNSNPETVSTDFDTSDRLYFEPLDEECIRDILENEGIEETQVITQFGGQTAINLAEPLAHANAVLIGSDVEAIDLAEDRRRFEDFLASLGIPQPPGGAVTRLADALVVAENIGYPVLVRPSYVLGGRAMEIVYNPAELTEYLGRATEVSPKKPILVDKYLVGREVEVDAICDGEDVLIPGIMEHIERAGVHSGDSIAVYPAQNLSPETEAELVNYTIQIGRGLKVKGLMNVQYVIHRGQVYVLEVNPRASRTVPFLSKVTGVPMVRAATWVALGRSLKEQGFSTRLWPKSPLVAMKAPVFSMAKLVDVDTYLGPEMKSTGEVMGIDRDYRGALIKTLIASRASLPPHGNLLLSIADRDKAEATPLIDLLAAAGYSFFATAGTAKLINSLGHEVLGVARKIQEGHPHVVDLIEAGKVNGVVNTVTGVRTATQDGFADGFAIRRAATERGLPCFTSLDTLRAAVESLAGTAKGYSILPLTAYLSPSEVPSAVGEENPA
ncbi:MAG TPA: carbamoyl-phosphate synthase large subunit [Chloroflexota bacterium]|nr:carbamoyl-phosphate synthase large subunit [Chloroflexota bacterium]